MIPLTTAQIPLTTAQQTQAQLDSAPMRAARDQLNASGWAPTLVPPIEGLSDVARVLYGEVVASLEVAHGMGETWLEAAAFQCWYEALAEAWARGEVRPPGGGDFSALFGETFAHLASDVAYDVCCRDPFALLGPAGELIEALQAVEAS